MRIIGFNLTRILVERKEKSKEKIEIKQNINIDNVSKDKIPISQEDMLKIEFNFTVDYNPDFAKLDFKGQIMVLPDKEELKKFLKSWKSKEIPEQVRTPLFNFIMGKCNIKALTLEDEMGLPLHVPMPRLNQEK